MSDKRNVKDLLKVYMNIMISGFAFMSLLIFSVFVALLPIFGTMIYFENYNNAFGMVIMISGYALYFVVASYYGFFDDILKELESK